jgi:sortase A
VTKVHPGLIRRRHPAPDELVGSSDPAPPVPATDDPRDLAGGAKKTALVWTERILGATGIACLAVVLYAFVDARWFAYVQGRRLDDALQARAAAGDTPADGAAGTASTDSSGAASQTDNLDTFRAGVMEPQPDEGALIGRIEIPRLGISSLILQGVASETLRRGVGHIPDTSLPQMPGNVGLAGHRDTVFRGLKDVRKDDLIDLDTLAGSYRYVVDWSRVVDPADVIVLAASSRPELTLVTCYPFHYVGSAPQRFIVRAHLVEGGGGAAHATPGG